MFAFCVESASCLGCVGLCFVVAALEMDDTVGAAAV